MPRRPASSPRRDQVVRQAERMVADLRTRSKLREFFLQWLKVDQVPDIAKDPKRFPSSTRRWPPTCGLRSICFWMMSSAARRPISASSCAPITLYLNGRLAQLYGADLAADAPFQKVQLEPGERAGVLTHPYLMATFRLHGEQLADPSRGLPGPQRPGPRRFGRRPKPSPRSPPDLHPDLTTRQRVTLQTKPESCQSCHGMINPLGFTLEHFDAVGRYPKG